jgi:hypothetical protein
LKIVESEATDEEIEDQFSLQLEQLIRHCEDELGLIPKMAEWKPWDVPPGYKVCVPHSVLVLQHLQCSSKNLQNFRGPL